MKKGLVKILNLVYLAAAVTSTFLIATDPIVDLNVHIHLSSEQIGNLVSKAMGGAEEDGSAETTTKAIKRGEGEELDIKNMLTGPKIAEAFGDEGFTLDVPLKIEAKYAYRLKRKDVVDIVINDNIKNILDKAITSLTTPLNKLIRNVTEEFATNVLQDQITDQLNTYFVGVDVKEEDVNQIFSNVFDLLDNNGAKEVTVDDLSDTIMGAPTEFALANPQPSLETFGDDLYYVKANEVYNREKEFDATHEYYVATKYSSGVYSIFMDAQNASAVYMKIDSVVDSTTFDEAKAGYKTLYKQSGENQYEEVTAFDESVAAYFRKTTFTKDSSITNEETFLAALGNHQLYKSSAEKQYELVDSYEEGIEYYYESNFSMADVNPDIIHDAMVDALANIPGLVNTTYKKLEGEEAITSAEKFAAAGKLFVKEGEDYKEASEYAEGTEYYAIETQTISNINEALIGLLDGLGGGSNPPAVTNEQSSDGENKAIIRTRAETQTSEDALNEKIKDFVLEKIPLDTVSEFTGKFADKVPLILLGVIVLFALPWAWFALVTLFRTLRKRKFWTRPGIVFFWAFPQLILGIGLLLVGKYGVPFAVKMFGDKVEMIKEYGDALSLNLKTGVLIPSYIYLGMIPFTIFYKIIAHPVKREYKINKKLRKAEKRG